MFLHAVPAVPLPSAMKILVLLVLVATVVVVSGEPTVCSEDIQHKPATLRLRRDLFCDHDPYVRPGTHDNATTITLLLLTKFIEFDDSKDEFTVHGWMGLFWNDTALHWKPSDYDEIRTISVSSSEIWGPYISVLNSGDMGYSQDTLPETNCLLRYNGHVTCIPEVKYVSRCVANLERWPFDKHNCTIELGSPVENIEFDYMSGGITVHSYERNREWDLLSFNATTYADRYNIEISIPIIYFEYSIERHSSGMRAAVVTPLIVLIILTLVVMWLDPNTNERFALAVIDFICHLLCIQDLFWVLPHNGPTSPHILNLYRDSLVMSGMAIFLTVFLRRIKTTKLESPHWITLPTSRFVQTKLGQVLVLTYLDPTASAHLGGNEDSADLLESNSKATKASNNTWLYVSIFIDRVAMFSFCLTYIIMILVLIPHSDLKSPDLDIPF